MDDDRFDALLRTLHRAGSRHGALTAVRTRTSSRRAVLPLLGGLLLARLVPAPEAQAKMKRRGCKGGKTKCAGSCVDLLSHPSHCGSCDSGCAGDQSCQGGQCVGGGGGGGCDPDCQFNEVCQNGTCVAAANVCAGPTGICNADPTPCGQAATGETCGCERTVEGNNVCVNGVNACTDVECTSSQDCFEFGLHFFCQAAKKNAQGRFCGCGFGTATGQVCVAECDNIGGGGGGTLGVFEICERDANTCQAGLRCDSPTTRHTCSDTVAGIDTWCCVPPGGPCTECECCGDFACDFGDANPDGACRCNPEDGGCAGGACETSDDCLGNTPDCCGGTCVDTLGDNAHCGGCNSPCPGGQTCGAGICNA